MTHITLSGQNGYALPRAVLADDEEIGTVAPTTYNDGVTMPTWAAIDNRGNDPGDRYVSDWAAATQLAVRLGIKAIRA